MTDFFQSVVKLAGTEREVDNGSKCRNNDWSTVFKEPGWDWVRVALFIGRVYCLVYVGGVN